MADNSPTTDIRCRVGQFWHSLKYLVCSCGCRRVLVSGNYNHNNCSQKVFKMAARQIPRRILSFLTSNPPPPPLLPQPRVLSRRGNLLLLLPLYLHEVARSCKMLITIFFSYICMCFWDVLDHVLETLTNVTEFSERCIIFMWVFFFPFLIL